MLPIMWYYENRINIFGGFSVGGGTSFFIIIFSHTNTNLFYFLFYSISSFIVFYSFKCQEMIGGRLDLIQMNGH